MSKTKWPALKVLCGSYFHQDWKLEADSEDGLLEAFARREGAAQTRQAISEIDKLLASPQDPAQRRALLNELGCDYRLPKGEELNDWLWQTRQRLEAELVK